MKTQRFFQFALALFIFLFTLSAHARLADEVADGRFKYPIYVGLVGGYGSTTWGNLVPDALDSSIVIATPVRVTEGGGVWGVYGGYEIIPYFALELSWMRYPSADIYFHPYSLFTYHNEGQSKLVSGTDRISLVGKVMLIIPGTTVRAYSSFGAAEVHRMDSYVDRWRLSPSFGAGLSYNLNKRWMAELGTEYVAGYGQSEQSPVRHYIPFLYSVFLRLAYRF